MPTYEYACAKCEHHFEIVQPITSKAMLICPKDQCPKKPWGKGKIKRVIGTGGGLIFKGTGFYTTDYRSDSYKAAAKKDASSTNTSSGSTASAKKESKPAEPAKPKPSGGASTPAKSD